MKQFEENPKDIKEYMENYFNRIEQNQNRVSSSEYIQWVYDFVTKNGQADDESALYLYEDIDKENGELLSAFLDHIKETAKSQRVLVVAEEDCHFSNETILIKIRDKYFKMFRIYGQGSWTSICLLETDPDCAYVKLG